MNSTQLGHEIGRILAMVASDDLTLNQAADEAQSAIDEFEKGANEAVAPLQAEVERLKSEIQKWEIGCVANANDAAASHRHADNQRLEILKLQSSLGQREKQLADALEQAKEFKTAYDLAQSELTTLRADKRRLTDGLQDLFEMMDEGIIVRDTSRDAEESYAERMIKFVTRLKVAHSALDSAMQNEKGNP